MKPRYIHFTIRWTAIDELTHVVTNDHRRYCDGAPVRGNNHVPRHNDQCYATCLRCVQPPFVTIWPNGSGMMKAR